MSTAVEMTTVGRPDAAAAVTEVCDATDEPMLLDDKPATPPLQVPLDIVTGPVDGPEIPQPDVEMKELIDIEMPTEVIALPEPEPPLPPMVTETEIRTLQSQLLMEESKLILMKKMLQLQSAPPKLERKDDLVAADRKAPGLPGKLGNGPVHQNGVKNAKPGFMGARLDKVNLKDPKMQSMMKGGIVASNHPRSNIGPAVLELSKSLAHKQSLNMAKAQQTANHSSGGQNTGSRGGGGQMPLQQSRQQPQTHPLERLEQQLSEEKALLKRQMEKHVLQIVPPKPSAPDMNFIPATVCPDFIALLGMELAASYAITSRNLVDQSPYPDPFVCLSCRENVCPAWKVDVETGAVVCESCFAAGRTNAARLSHIENLKVAFADVVEKEGELDRRHAATMVKAKASHLAENIAPAPLPAYSLQKQQQSVQKNHLPVHNNNNNSYHNSHSNSNSTNNNAHHTTNRPTARQQQQQHMANSSHQQHHHHHQQQQQQLMGQVHRVNLPPAPQSRHSVKPTFSNPYQGMGTPLPYAPTSSMSSAAASNTKHLPYHHGGGGGAGNAIASRQTVERQYLLDMISRPQKQQQQQQHQQQQQSANAWRK